MKWFVLSPQMVSSKEPLRMFCICNVERFLYSTQYLFERTIVIHVTMWKKFYFCQHWLKDNITNPLCILIWILLSAPSKSHQHRVLLLRVFSFFSPLQMHDFSTFPARIIQTSGNQPHNFGNCGSSPHHCTPIGRGKSLIMGTSSGARGLVGVKSPPPCGRRWHLP